MRPVPDADLSKLRALAGQLAAAWNAMDGGAFADLFTDDAVFVDIKANRDDGRAAIRDRHVALFGSVFRGTSVAYDLVDAATAAPGLALGHVRAHVSFGGQTLETLATCVFRQEGEGWRLLAFHNTEVGHY